MIPKQDAAVITQSLEKPSYVLCIALNLLMPNTI